MARPFIRLMVPGATPVAGSTPPPGGPERASTVALETDARLLEASRRPGADR